MSTFRRHLIRAMEKLETNEVRKHLITLDRFSSHYPNTSLDERCHSSIGHTTHPAFTNTPFLPGCNLYQLKPNYSASKAIEDLLHTYETVIDCGMAIGIAYYYALLQSMIEIHGEQNGKARFDAIFGDTAGNVPNERRILISKDGPMLLTQEGEKEVKIFTEPYQILSLLVEAKERNKLELTGAIITFKGDPYYYVKHPFGNEGNYNCVVVSIPPTSKQILVRTFGLEGPLSEEGLLEKHLSAFAAEPSVESRFISRTDNYHLQKLQARREAIQGFSNKIIDCDDGMINIFLKSDLTQVLRLIKEGMKIQKEIFGESEKPDWQAAVKLINKRESDAANLPETKPPAAMVLAYSAAKAKVKTVTTSSTDKEPAKKKGWNTGFYK